MKSIYIWSIVIVLFLSALSLWASICFDLPLEYVAWIPSTVALVISVISLSVADPKQKELQLEIKVWGRNRDASGLPLNLVFQVTNKGVIALNLPKFHFRSPQKILSIDNSRRDQKYQVYEYGETILLLNDQIKFLGTNQGDRSIRFDHSVNLSEWNKGNFYFSIHCDGYKVKTVKMTKEQRDKIVNSKSEEPIILNE